jgi:hypothetical protein
VAGSESGGVSVTPEFGWPLIEPTDFVTNLPADFETFADAVDDDLKGLNGGTTGQVLTKDSATDLDFSWGTPIAGGITQIATGALSGASVDLTSIPATYKDLILILQDIVPVTDNVQLLIRSNSVTSNYHGVIAKNEGASGNASSSGTSSYFNDGANMDNTDKNNFHYLRFFDYANSITRKMCQFNFASTAPNGTDNVTGFGASRQNSPNAITSIQISFSSGDISQGTYILYGVS